LSEIMCMFFVLSTCLPSNGVSCIPILEKVLGQTFEVQSLQLGLVKVSFNTALQFGALACCVNHLVAGLTLCLVKSCAVKNKLSDCTL
jgi:hypothetical protein